MKFDETFYVKKIGGIYISWHYPSGYKITVGETKEKIIELLEKRWEKERGQLQL